MAEVNHGKRNRIICISTAIILCLLFIFVPIIWLIPLPFGYSVEFTVYYEDSAYFVGEPAEGIEMLLDGVYYGTTDEFGMLEFGISDKENHTVSIFYNDGLIYKYLIEYGTEITQVDVFLQTMSLEAEFRWDKVGEQDVVIGESFELWFDRDGVFELVGTQTTNGLGIILFDGLIMGEYKRYMIVIYLYKFVGIDHEIPLVLIELNQSIAFKSVVLLVIPVTIMFDFDYEDSVIFGADYPIEGLSYTFQAWEAIGWDAGQPIYGWVIKSTGFTDSEGRIYIYNLEAYTMTNPMNMQHHFTVTNFKTVWSYDGVASEQDYYAGDDLDFYYELACKEVQATFNWNVAGLPAANNTDVWLTFLDGTHAPMMFTTDANGQLTITGLIMGNYSLESAVFETIQSVHTTVIPQILIEPTKGKGVLKNWFKINSNFNFCFFYFSIIL